MRPVAGKMSGRLSEYRCDGRTGLIQYSPRALRGYLVLLLKGDHMVALERRDTRAQAVELVADHLGVA